MIYTHNISPTLISLFGLEVRWYGLMYVLGFFIIQYLGWYCWRYFSVKDQNRATVFKTTKKETFESLIFWVFVAGVLGGRIGFFLFYYPNLLIADPLEFFRVWNGGMSIHGGFLFGSLTGIYLARKNKLPLLSSADVFVLPMSIGLFFGRIANFINGELYGHPTDQTWGVIFPQVDELMRHPSQLYHASKDLILALILTLIIYKAGFKKPGLLTAYFLFFYGLIRFIIEFYRVPDHYIGPVTTGQFLCVIMMALALTIAFRQKFWKMNTV